MGLPGTWEGHYGENGSLRAREGHRGEYGLLKVKACTRSDDEKKEAGLGKCFLDAFIRFGLKKEMVCGLTLKFLFYSEECSLK